MSGLFADCPEDLLELIAAALVVSDNFARLRPPTPAAKQRADYFGRFGDSSDTSATDALALLGRMRCVCSNWRHIGFYALARAAPKTMLWRLATAPTLVPARAHAEVVAGIVAAGNVLLAPKQPRAPRPPQAAVRKRRRADGGFGTKPACVNSELFGVTAVLQFCFAAAVAAGNFSLLAHRELFGDHAQWSRSRKRSVLRLAVERDPALVRLLAADYGVSRRSVRGGARAILALAVGHGTPAMFAEVVAVFGLAGEIYAHRRLLLVRALRNPDMFAVLAKWATHEDARTAGVYVEALRTGNGHALKAIARVFGARAEFMRELFTESGNFYEFSYLKRTSVPRDAGARVSALTGSPCVTDEFIETLLIDYELPPSLIPKTVRTFLERVSPRDNFNSSASAVALAHKLKLLPADYKPLPPIEKDYWSFYRLLSVPCCSRNHARIRQALGWDQGRGENNTFSRWRIRLAALEADTDVTENESEFVQGLVEQADHNTILAFFEKFTLPVAVLRAHRDRLVRTAAARGEINIVKKLVELTGFDIYGNSLELFRIIITTQSGRTFADFEVIFPLSPARFCSDNNVLLRTIIETNHALLLEHLIALRRLSPDALRYNNHYLLRLTAVFGNQFTLQVLSGASLRPVDAATLREARVLAIQIGRPDIYAHFEQLFA